MIRCDQGSEPGGQPLLRPVTLGDLRLPNRVVMAPLTRARATNSELVPTDLHAAYYGQRATAGLIVAESAWVSERAIGFPGVPGIYSERQVAAWRRVAGVVHALGGRVVLQLWHTGAGSHPDHLGGALPAGPSAVDPGEVCWTAAGPRPTVTPREMTAAEIGRTVADYGAASERAHRAGFDGVEIAANGTYLIAQFLNPRLNRRADGYGTDRGRLLLEIVDAVTAAWDGRRTGVRLSPYWTVRDTSAGVRGDGYPYTADEETLAAFDGLVAELDRRPLAYLHLRGPVPGGVPDFDAFARYRKLFGGALIANHGFGRESGNAIVEAGVADAVSFARPFVANPDLVARFALGQGTARGDRGTHYRGGARGYVDYPIWAGS
ncbi:alkene reductase [Spirillospora sp. CA-142024]|uniref:alkene reductase n=1 Tax=Spirillospora sp. CA-142024 TaxID=3240036 RepID=UPI003D91E972